MGLNLIVITLLLVSCATSRVENLSKPSTPSGVAIPVTGTDLQIVQRASEILSDKSKWNRHDTRDCSKNAVIFSLYCALFKASVDINGKFDHRAAALEEIRRTVEDESKGKAYEHRLMGYNNDVDTQFLDIRRVLAITEKRLKTRL